MNFKTQTIAIADATDDNLRQFAAGALGIFLAPNAKRENMLAKITAAHQGDTITVLVPVSAESEIGTIERAEDVAPQPNASSAPVAAPRPAAKPGELKEPMWTVLIERAKGKGGNDPVFVSVNGVAMLIERGKAQTIKHRYYEVLENSKELVGEEEGEGKDATIVWTLVPAYPFNVQQRPSDAELLAWRNRSQPQPVADAA